MCSYILSDSEVSLLDIVYMCKSGGGQFINKLSAFKKKSYTYITIYVTFSSGNTIFKLKRGENCKTFQEPEAVFWIISQ